MGSQGSKKRRRKKQSSDYLPPTSKKFCERCNKETIFKYNPNVGHSECIECGWRGMNYVQ